MKLTVVVSYYKALNNLKVILNALNHQSEKDFEVILSEDDFNTQTFDFLNQNTAKFNFHIQHIHQEVDNGFRKNQMLNEAIRRSKCEYIAFIDGDCIPHKHFVKQYVKQMKPGFFYAGRSVMLGQKIAELTVRNNSLKYLKFFRLLFTDTTFLKEGIYSPFLPLKLKSKGLLGRNWGVKKAHLIAINGFDEDYTKAGVGEDVDIEWRLMASSIERKSIKNKAIVYHIYHARTYGEDGVQANYALMRQKQAENQLFCINGLVKKV